MKKLILIVAAMAAFGIAGTAFAGNEIAAVTDPTPDGSFTGTYKISNDDPSTPQNEERWGTQTGYVGVYDDGVVACNGNAQTLYRPDTNEPLVGYIWVGPGEAADTSTAEAPGKVAGAGDNHGGANNANAPTGKGPCPGHNAPN